MLGVFDSGAGGALAVKLLRERLPRADIAFFGDRKHAPFGTKTEAELLPLVERDLERLFRFGVSKTLIACVSAGTLFDKLPPATRARAFSILPPTAAAALRQTKNGKIALLATERTVRCGVLRKMLEARADVSVSAKSAGALVTLAECEGRTDEKTRRAVKEALSAFGDFPYDTLVLGCTHFPLFGETFRTFCPAVSVVSSTEVGVEAFIRTLCDEEKRGNGKTVLLA